MPEILTLAFVPLQFEEPERFPRAVLPALCKYSSGFTGKSKLIIWLTSGISSPLADKSEETRTLHLPLLKASKALCRSSLEAFP